MKPGTTKLKLSKAATLLGLSTKTLQRMDKDGRLPAWRTVTNQRMWTRRQLLRYMKGEAHE